MKSIIHFRAEEFKPVQRIDMEIDGNEIFISLQLDGGSIERT